MLVLKKEVLAKLRNSAGVRGRICAELDIAYTTLQRWVTHNDISLTLATSLKVLEESFRIHADEMIEEVAPSNMKRKKDVRTKKNKLDKEDVLTIRKRLSKGDDRKAIANDYGVDYSTITDINNRRSWKKVKPV